MTRNRLVALFWVAMMVVATALMVRFPIYRMPRLVQRFYLSEKMHILGHLCLFGVLAYLITSMFWGRSGPARLLNWRTGALLVVTLAVGLVQEAIQLTARGLNSFHRPELFDLGVDLVGAVVGLLVFHAVRYCRILWRRKRQGCPATPPRKVHGRSDSSHK